MTRRARQTFKSKPVFRDRDKKRTTPPTPVPSMWLQQPQPSVCKDNRQPRISISIDQSSFSFSTSAFIVVVVLPPGAILPATATELNTLSSHIREWINNKNFMSGLIYIIIGGRICWNLHALKNYYLTSYNFIPYPSTKRM